MKLALSKSPENYSALIARSWGLYKHTFKRAYWLALLVAVIIFIPRLICVAVGQNVFIATKHWTNQQILFIAIYLSTLWFFAAILWCIHCVQQGKKENFITDLKMAGRRLFYVIGAAILLSLVGLASIVVALAMHYLYLALGLYTVNHLFSAVLLFTVLLARVAIPVYISLLFYFYFPLIVIENDKILSSLKDSASLVWGYAWRTLCILLTPWLIYLVTLVLIKAILGINIHIYFMPYEPASNFYTAGLHIIILSLFILWAACLMLVQLHDLELRRKAVKKKK